ncbi:MAG: 1-(5-phosphoribosyl)-5-[(5-phosphoribosylamino)methylideneamino]imidazole-4-carboxamide isomerase [Euryarchaeota archaeon]|nr:1-(5-phosphoribosyl)-5-[(5-phosphoribosylamino)methylideneamino]imidazole-4-carboxamide isomerase [Euryarchaeota archaeon]
MFLVIPALDLKDGKCVQLVGGDPGKRLIEEEDPLAVARGWESRGASRLHLIDLDGTIGGVRKNEAVVEEILRALAIPVQFGGGMRTLGDAMHFLDLGAERVILGTMAVEDPESLAPLVEKYGRERITIALDSRGGYVTVKGWQESTAHRPWDLAPVLEAYADEFLFTNVDVEGRMAGIDRDIISRVVESTSSGVIVSGGIASLEDVRTARELGARGVVIGSALYTGRMDFKKARELEETAE